MSPRFLVLLLLGFLSAVPAAAQAEPARVSLSVREADLRDVLRAAAQGTDLNINFEPDLNTTLRGVELKQMTLQEILDEILPSQGLAYSRQGRTIYVHRGDGGLRFYTVDMLSLRRAGSKSFQVNASGQLVQSTGGGQGGGSQGGGQGGQSGNSSAYTSSLASGNAFDSWQELETGLSTLIFGQPMEAKSLSGSSGTPAAPASRGMAKDGRSLVIQPESGLIVVGADPSTHLRVNAYLKELRRRNERQVILEARIVEVTLGADSQIGVDWNSVLNVGAASGGTGTDVQGSFVTGGTLNSNLQSGDGLARLIVQNARVTAALSALAREGRLQVLSAPRISTLNNQKAILRVVREEAFFLQNSQVTPGGTFGGNIATVQITPVVVPVGIVLDIQPQIGEDGTITLAVNPSVSEIVTVRSFSVAGSGGGASATLPVVDRRDLDTVVRIRNGETLVLAGIIRNKEGDDDRGVPWLRRIPLLGNLFTKREKMKSHTELAIFITPTLIESADQVAAQRKDTEQRLDKAGSDLKAEPKKTLDFKEP